MMVEPQITIVGLGRTGRSIGLALRKAKAPSRVVGHDRDGAVAGQARKLGAVEKTEWNLIAACEQADLVILSIPFSGIHDTLQAIAPHVKKGCVITDTAPVKGRVIAWAEELLPAGVYFVGGHPIVVAEGEGEEAARADLFHGAVYCLTPTPGVSEEAVQAVTELVYLLEAAPLFLDAVEHDGLVAGVEQLPPLLALALARAVTSAQSWRDIRKLAGGLFERSTALLGGDAAAWSEMSLGNEANVVRWLDALIDELQQLRELIVAGDGQALQEAFEAAQSSRARWLAERAEGRWEDVPGPKIEDRPSLMKRLIGFG
jgi:prephenate dehydrogenase